MWMFGELYDKIVITLLVILAAAIFRLVLGDILKRKLRELVGHQILANFLSGIFGIVMIFYLLYLWDITQALVEWFAALGIIALILLFSIKDVWITDVFAGISLMGEKSIDIGTEVEIGGKRGRIVEMTLTNTKVKTADGSLMIVPNRKFREGIVIIRSAKKRH